MRPGGSTSRMIEKAVSDLPLPDSPTSPSVSPARIEKLTSITAGTKRPSTSKPVVRCSTSRSAAAQTSISVCSPNTARMRVRDLADRRAGFHRQDDGRHEVVGAAGGRADAVEGAAPGCRHHATPARWRPARSGAARSPGRCAAPRSSAARVVVNWLTPTTTLAPAVDRLLRAVGRLLDLALDHALLDRGEGAARGVDPRQQRDAPPPRSRSVCCSMW